RGRTRAASICSGDPPAVLRRPSAQDIGGRSRPAATGSTSLGTPGPDPCHSCGKTSGLLTSGLHNSGSTSQSLLLAPPAIICSTPIAADILHTRPHYALRLRST